MPNCFIIMPITTPSLYLEEYGDDKHHFAHVLDHLFIPAIEGIDYSPITPIMKGADIIHAEIIKNLGEADLVLCDMSILNPNVFFELGIRTALDKPVCLVKDSRTKQVPFDTSIINYHTYNHELHPWNLKDEIPKLEAHLTESIENSNQQNSLWKYFGLTQPGRYEEGNYSTEEKLDFLIKEVSNLRKVSSPSRGEGSTIFPSRISLPQEAVNIFNHNVSNIDETTAAIIQGAPISVDAKENILYLGLPSSAWGLDHTLPVNMNAIESIAKKMFGVDEVIIHHEDF